jgi:hypothetical protein
MESDNTWLKSNRNKNVDDENTVNSTLMIGHAFQGTVQQLLEEDPQYRSGVSTVVREFGVKASIQCNHPAQGRQEEELTTLPQCIKDVMRQSG